jgi:hypothetical protein
MPTKIELKSVTLIIYFINKLNLGIYDFKRDKLLPKRLAVADSFDGYARDDYIDYDFTDF